MFFSFFFSFFFFKQKTAYEMRISDWSSDVCSSDLFLRGVDGLRLVGGGVAIAIEDRQIVFDLRERMKGDGAVVGTGFVECGAGLADLRFTQAAVEQVEREAGADRPDQIRCLEPVAAVAADRQSVV